MTSLRIAALRRKIARTSEPTKLTELKRELAALLAALPEPKAEPPVRRRAPEHVTATPAPPAKRGPGRPRTRPASTAK